MCGIVGVLTQTSNNKGRADLVTEAISRIHHRGPDESGFSSRDLDGEYSLRVAHNRLSISGREDGTQPIGDSDGNLLVFNGEIYNYKELALELSGVGVQSSSTSDSAVLFLWLKTFGMNRLGSLNGMFAFAFFEARSKKLFLARDRFGIKPMYFQQSKSALIFSSEIKALLNFQTDSPSVDSIAAINFLFFGEVDRGSQTFFQGISSVVPGRYIEVLEDDCALSVKSVLWCAPEFAPNETATQTAASQKLRSLLALSVAKHQTGDQPVAYSLSGGIDSTGLVGLARSISRTYPIKTFSYVDSLEKFDESRWIDLASEALATEKVIAKGAVFDLAYLDEVLKVQDEPFISPSVLAQHYLYTRVRADGTKVLLDGQGADELLGGYAGARLPLLLDFISARKFGLAIRTIFSILSRGVEGLIQALVEGLVLFEDSYLAKIYKLVRILINPKIKISWKFKYAKSAFLKAESESAPLNKSNYLASYSWRMLHTGGLQALLRYADRNAMASSVENRVPYLENNLVDYVLGLQPTVMAHEPRTSKELLRKSLVGAVPKEILNRNDKLGFEGTFDYPRANDARLIEADLAIKSVPFLRNLSLNSSKSKKNDPRLYWRLLVLGRWLAIMGLEDWTLGNE